MTNFPDRSRRDEQLDGDRRHLNNAQLQNFERGSAGPTPTW
jgi:hypothetical protein